MPAVKLAVIFYSTYSTNLRMARIAADRIPFIGYHMPFPAMGYLEPQGDGFRMVPASYQLML